MSAALTGMADCEKYLLAHMVYQHLPPEIARRDFARQPLPLGEMIDLIPWCETGVALPKGPDGTGLHDTRSTARQLKAMYEMHPYLHDLRLTGYVNDNLGSYSNTDGVRRTSFVAMAFRDDAQNGIVVFSGCETHHLRPMLTDYAGCFVAMLGKVTKQHRQALQFYDTAMVGLTGERGVIGHSKGGNLATYVFINRLQDPLMAYCINAQPYCWWAMNRQQQTSLKSDRYEFIAHAGDVVHHAGYVSYISRIAQVNPYLGRNQIISLHGFKSMQFDSMGNLEGSRRLRTTRHTLKSRLFNDDVSEQAPQRETVLARLEAFRAQGMEPMRLLSVALEELCLATQADTALVLLRATHDSGDILYTLQARGDSTRQLQTFRLKLSRDDLMAQALVRGETVRQSAQYEAHFLPLAHVLGWPVHSGEVIPLGEKDAPWLGTLELLSKDGTLTQADRALGQALAPMLCTLAKQLRKDGDPRPLLRMTRAGEKLLEIPHHAYHVVRYRYAAERTAWLRLFCKGRLAKDETLLVDGWTLLPESTDQLHNWCGKDVAVVGRTEGWAFRHHRAREMSPEEAAELMGLKACGFKELQRLSRRPISPHASDAEAESVTLRARIALCLLHRPRLIVFDAAGCAEETLWELSAYLHLLCYDKQTTVLVLQGQ